MRMVGSVASTVMLPLCRRSFYAGNCKTLSTSPETSRLHFGKLVIHTCTHTRVCTHVQTQVYTHPPDSHMYTYMYTLVYTHRHVHIRVLFTFIQCVTLRVLSVDCRSIRLCWGNQCFQDRYGQSDFQDSVLVYIVYCYSLDWS